MGLGSVVVERSFGEGGWVEETGGFEEEEDGFVEEGEDGEVRDRM